MTRSKLCEITVSVDLPTKPNPALHVDINYLRQASGNVRMMLIASCMKSLLEDGVQIGMRLGLTREQTGNLIGKLASDNTLKAEEPK